MNQIFLKKILTILFFGALLTIASCQKSDALDRMQKWMKPSDKLKVLSTTAMIHDLVEEVGGEYVDSLPLIQGELDPHTYQLVKGDDEKFAAADLIFHNGLGLEHGPSLRYYLTENEKAVSLGDWIKKMYPEEILVVQGQLDPHIWMDVSLWAKTIKPIVIALSQADPEHAEIYEINGTKLFTKLMGVHEFVKKILQDVPDHKRYLITSHDAFNYFARAYLATQEERKLGTWQNRFDAPEGLAPESQLSVSDIQIIIDYAEKFDVHVLFPESNVSQDSIKKIVFAGNEKGMDLKIASKPLYGDAMGLPSSGADSYEGMMIHNAQTISEYLNNS